MILSDSILNSIPSNLDEKEAAFIRAGTHSLKMIDVSYKRLCSFLLNNSVTHTATEIAMIDVWNIIDSSHRLRCILEKTPGLKKNLAWFQLTIRKLKELEEIRHFIQHYDREIDKLNLNIKPLLGHISWCQYKNETQFIVRVSVPGHIKKF